MGNAVIRGSQRTVAVVADPDVHIGAFARHAFNNDAFYVNDTAVVRVARVSGTVHIS
jgi:hypothetical protein